MRSTSTRGTWRRSRRSCAPTGSVCTRAAATTWTCRTTLAYVQDDWKMTNKLTLNLGVRYDLTVGSFAQNGEFEPFMEAGRPQDADNIQPRVGFAYQLNDRTVVRGGAGKYYAEVITPVVLYALEPATVAILEVANDGRPDFALNPFNGPAPTFDQALTRFCSAPEQAANFAAWRARGFAGAAPCVLRGAGEMAPPAEYAHVPHTWQGTIGMQRQFGSTMSVEADYVYSRGRRREVHSGQREPELHECEWHRRQQSVHESVAASVSGLRHRGDDAVHRHLRLSRAADGVHQAPEQQLAGRSDLLPCRAVERRGSAADGRSWNDARRGAVPGGRRPWRPRRMDLCAERSAASRRVQWHLAGGPAGSR